MEKPEIPDELLARPAIPLPPERVPAARRKLNVAPSTAGTGRMRPIMQSDVAAHIIDPFGDGSGCRRKLEAVGGLVGGAPDLIRRREQTAR